uniref:Uncharacterized protein n=1 Tax=Acrobeloides nanus TaxID=290746 RepID=A0A914DJS2_9BILA
MKQVEASVEYNGRFLRVWKEEKQNYSRYFVTPLCELISSSIKCSQDDYSKDQDYTVSLSLRLWSHKAAEFVKLAIAQKGVNISIDDIYPIPMQMYRLGTNKRLIFEIDNQWRLNQHQHKEVIFDLRTKNKDFCEKMTKDAREDPREFLDKTRLYLEFSMLAPKQTHIDVNITKEKLQKSEFFNRINKCHKNQGIVYLTTSDMNKLSNEILNATIAHDEISSENIPIEDKENIIKSLTEIIEEQQVPASNLSKEEWSSLFLHDQNSIRITWPRQKFGPNRLVLHRVNTTCLLSREEILYKRIVATIIPATQQIEIQPEFLENDTYSTKPNGELQSTFRKEEENFKTKLELDYKLLTSKLTSLEETMNQAMANFHIKISTLAIAQKDIQNDTDLLITHISNIQRYIINNSNDLETLKSTTSNIWNKFYW